MERKTQIKNTKHTYLKIFSISIFVILISCRSSPISDEAFNSTAWKTDKNGCLGDRLKLLADFESVKNQMLDLSENQIRSLLGAPDKVQLFERSQKFYVYYIEKGGQCEGKGKVGRHYQVRFNSLNQVNEVSLALPVN